MLAIGEYTLRTWGADEAVFYLDGLEGCCQLLAARPDLGRPCGDIRPGLRRMEHGSRIIFYRRIAKGILVSRVLHQRMLPKRRAIDEES